VLYQTALAGAETAQGLAEEARDSAQLAETGAISAKEGILLDPDFIAVAAQLDDIATVAGIAADITIVAAGISDIDRVEDIAAEITTVAGIKDEIVTVAAKSTELSGVYAKLAEIEALYGRTTEIDALYAQLDTIAEKANTVSPTFDASTGPVTILNTGTGNSLEAPNFSVSKDGEITSPTITALEEVKADQSDLETLQVKTTENDLAIQAIQRDQTLENQSESSISASDYGIVALPKNATGTLKMKREGLTARNIVNGASIAIGGTVTFASVLSNIYYDTLNKVQITGTGSDITATNSSGAIANMAIINLTQTFSSVPTLAQCKNIFPTYFADTKSVPFTGRYRGRGKNVFDGELETGIYSITTGAKVVLTTATRSKNKIKTTAGSTRISGLPTTGDKWALLYDRNGNFKSYTLIATVGVTVGTITAIDGYLAFYATSTPLYQGNVIQVELGSTATTYEPYESHDLYFTAPEGRSVPSAKDSVEVVDGKLVHVQRVSEDITDLTELTSWVSGSSTEQVDTMRFYLTTSYTDAKYATDNNAVLTIGTVSFLCVASNYGIDYECFMIYEGKLYLRILKSRLATLDIDGFNTWLATQNSSILRYQLATPITTPIDQDGAIPAGESVYFEPVIADVGIYSDKFDILDTDYPISSIDKLYKVDFETGVPTLLTDAVIASDGLSFTSASLSDGDLVNVLYYYATANPEGLTTATYLNSNVVVADSANGKYYKYKPTITNGAIASWTLTEVV
jgi:hypothetical protein